MMRFEKTQRGVRITTHNGSVVTAHRAVIVAGVESNELLKTEAGTLKSPTRSLVSRSLNVYGGNGITFSVIAAEIIRDNFLGIKNSDAHIFRFGR